jgi:hypothetical protein
LIFFNSNYPSLTSTTSVSNPLVAETPPTTNDSVHTEMDARVAMATPRTIQSESQAQALASPNPAAKRNFKVNTDRCLVCFKLVRNLRGHTLSPFYHLNSLVPASALRDHSHSNHDSTNGNDSAYHDWLGEPSNNSNNQRWVISLFDK